MRAPRFLRAVRISPGGALLARGLLGVLAGVAASIGTAQGASAQQLLPIAPVAAAVVDGRLEVTVVAAADPAFERLAARQVESRRRALSDAWYALHRFCDDAMATLRLSPAVAARVHRLLHASTPELQSRLLVDGACVLKLSVSRMVLRAATGKVAQLPWSS